MSFILDWLDHEPWKSLCEHINKGRNNMTWQEERRRMLQEEYDNLSKKEPMPITNTHPAVWDLVIKDIKDRDEFGQKKYNTRLQPFNGRNVLVDLYQELLDAVVYIRQLIYEQEHLNPNVHPNPSVPHVHEHDGTDAGAHPSDPYHCQCGSYFYKNK